MRVDPWSKYHSRFLVPLRTFNFEIIHARVIRHKERHVTLLTQMT